MGWRLLHVCYLIVFGALLTYLSLRLNIEERIARNLKHLIDNRPVICTFYEPIAEERRTTGMSDEQDKELLETWFKAWDAAGFKPKFLELSDAKEHPFYEEAEGKVLKAVGKSRYEQLCFLRWLAMAASGCGWMSDNDVLPMNVQPDKNLPNKGKFTLHDAAVPSLLSGSHKEWDRKSRQLIEVMEDVIAEGQYLSDMNALQYLSKIKPDEMIIKRDVLREVAYTELNKVDCSIAKGKTAVHFSHRRILEAFHKGFMPHIDKPKQTPGERAPYGKKFIKDWKEQCSEK